MIQTLPQHQMCGSARTVITQRVGLVQLVFLGTKRVMDKKKDRGFPRPFFIIEATIRSLLQDFPQQRAKGRNPQTQLPF